MDIILNFHNFHGNVKVVISKTCRNEFWKDVQNYKKPLNKTRRNSTENY